MGLFSKKKKPETLQETIDLLCEEAIRMAKKEGHDLDYSPESVKLVDEIILGLKDVAEDMDIPDEKYMYMANVWGAYVGQTFIKNLGKGEWTVHKDFDATGVKVGESYMFFPGKAFKMLKNGEEDSIAFMYTHFMNEQQKDDQGT